MKHKCYTCGFVLRDGIPLLQDITADREVLIGTPFEDLTPYNFCAYCLHMVTEFPSAFNKSNMHALVRHAGAVGCSCGHQYDSTTGWVHVNRCMIAHNAVAIYENGDFGFALELINSCM